MPPLAPKQKLAQAFSEPRIVLAIDYGTTYTGLAWMHSDGESTPQFSNLKLFTDWPGKNEPKVPSEVSYSMASGTASDRVYRPWGSTIDPKSKVLRWTKLKLFQDYSPLAELETLEGLIKGLADIKSLYSESDETTDVPRHLSRTSKDIIEFYLSFIAEEWVAYVTNQAQFVLDEVPVDIVVTHPAMWPDHARGALVQAVSGAFNKIIIPTRQNIYVKSEPEACTLYVIQDVLRKNAGALRVGECFTLCDAGGGTVDLVSYYLDSLAPLNLIRIGDATGAAIGATTVDRAFLRWLGTKVSNLDIHTGAYGKGDQYVLNSRVNNLLRRFEVFKRSFTGSESFDLQLPHVAVLAEPEEGNQTRLLHISSELMKEMFRESIEGVKKLIKQQVTQVEEGETPKGIRCRVSNIFLAGGFAESGYLYEEVQKTARMFPTIRVRRADDCWSSVVKGAVLAGMAIGAPLPPKVAICQSRYGLILKGKSPHAPREGSWTLDSHDENSFLLNPFTTTQLIWLAQKGDVIFPESQLRKSVKLWFKAKELGQTAKISFITNMSHTLPSQIEDLPQGETTIENLTVRLDRLLPTDFERWRKVEPKGETPKGEKYELLLELELTIMTAITINVKRGDRVIATHTAALSKYV